MCSLAISRARSLLTGIHLEPVIFLIFVAIAQTRLTVQELYVQKCCQVDLGHNETVCMNLSNHTEVELATQKFVSGLQGANGALQSVPSILVALVVGPLSDRYSRKPLLLGALLGYFLRDLVFLVNVVWWHELGAAWLLVEFLQDITGGELVFMTGLHALLADTVPPEERTKRFIILDFFMYLGNSVGVKPSVMLQQRFGWVALFVVNILILLLNAIYIHFMVREKARPKVEEDWGGFGGFVKKIGLSFVNLLKSHPSGRQPFIFILLLILIMFQFAGHGPSNLFFLFRKLQYKITLDQYANLSIFNLFRAFVTNLFLFPFLSRYVGDSSLLLLSIMTTICAYFIMTFGANLIMMYLAAASWFLYRAVYTIIRSLLSKLVDETEVGTVFTLNAVLAKLTDFVSYPCFALIYTQTVDTFPGAFGLVCAGTFFIMGIIIVPIRQRLSTLIKTKTEESEAKKEEKQNSARNPEEASL